MSAAPKMSIASGSPHEIGDILSDRFGRVRVIRQIMFSDLPDYERGRMLVIMDPLNDHKPLYFYEVERVAVDL